MRNRALSILLGAIALASPALPAAAQDVPGLVLFSSGKAGDPMPKGWEVIKINESKKLTDYKLVDDDGKMVLKATADQSASAIGQYISVDLTKTPVVEWRWKINKLIATADMEYARTEDSPARLVFAFDGDPKKLSLSDKTSGAIAKSISGHDLPFATLMYVWANKQPVDTIIRNPHTGQIRMIVVASGGAGVGKWQTLSRNVREDYKRAFGEYPGRMLHYGVLSDTDNTGDSIEAWYGDIVFKPAPK